MSSLFQVRGVWVFHGVIRLFDPGVTVGGLRVYFTLLGCVVRGVDACALLNDF